MMGTLLPVDATRYVKRSNSTLSGRTDSEEGIGGKLRSPAFGGNCFEFLEVIQNILKGQVFLLFGQNRPTVGKRSKFCRRRLLFR